MCERNGKKVVFCPKIVRFMKAFNFEQRKESELQKFVGLKGNVVEWRYGYVEKKIDYTLKIQGGREAYEYYNEGFLADAVW